MKHPFITILGLFFLTNFAFGQNIDTLKVVVLIPNKVEVADNYLTDYTKLRSDILTKRVDLKNQKLKDKKEHLKEYNVQPEYTKQMFDNELNFYDSLTIDNYISLVVREYIAYRLYKPFKIKPRLVFVQATKLNSSIDEYSKFAKGNKNLFIVNFPTMKLYKENNNFKVQTKIELYSSLTNEILLTKETIGLTKTEMTDYPMCSGNSWDCAFVNSVYPNLYDVLKIIAEKNTMKK